MAFARLRNVITSRVDTTRPTPPSTSGLRVIPVDHRRRRSITDDWEEVLDSSDSVYSISSNFDDDAATLAERDHAASDLEDQRSEEYTSDVRPDVTVAAASSAPFPVPPPEYELVVPSCEGYSPRTPSVAQRVPLSNSDAAGDDDKTLELSPTSPPPKHVRRIPSQETLADHSRSAPMDISPPTSKKRMSLSNRPSYQFPTLYNSGAPNADKAPESASHATNDIGFGSFNGIPHDPTTLHNAISGLTKLLATTAKRIAQSNPDDDSSPALFELEDVVHTLDEQVKDLEYIVRTYSKHWNARGSGLAAGEIPLGIGLWDWINDTSARLLAAQGRLLMLVNEKPGLQRLDGNALESETVALHHTTKLKEVQATMAKFLPIIKSDFDLFNTHLMTFPIPKARSDSSSSSRRQAPHPAIARMRHQLYNLKDQIQAHHNVLKSVHGSYPALRKKDIDQALQSLATVSTAITTILTNNGSEWIQSDLDSRNGGKQKVIPYADFVSLDADVLHDVAGHLQQMHKDLGLDSVPLEEICFTSTPLQNHRLHMLTSEGTMKKLLSTVEFVQSLLIPRDA